MPNPITKSDLERMAAEALEPFAKAAADYDRKVFGHPEADVTYAPLGRSYVLVDDLRRARAVRAAILKAGAMADGK